ncbi:hypothetical protein BDA99DRAFT_531246 [Phascolomyces articulosus]|uniref:Uncharacterized protein n=1 Tax=Phascolomyces articulosus TaxID=60185 RepID=A0AAD5KCL3_9FUNG|nr:hypothetical protein BDA99DRAFT_531246 [Phascolomyces articulosus]
MWIICSSVKKDAGTNSGNVLIEQSATRRQQRLDEDDENDDEGIGNGSETTASESTKENINEAITDPTTKNDGGNVELSEIWPPFYSSTIDELGCKSSLYYFWAWELGMINGIIIDGREKVTTGSRFWKSSGDVFGGRNASFWFLNIPTVKHSYEEDTRLPALVKLVIDEEDIVSFAGQAKSLGEKIYDFWSKSEMENYRNYSSIKTGGQYQSTGENGTASGRGQDGDGSATGRVVSTIDNESSSYDGSSSSSSSQHGTASGRARGRGRRGGGSASGMIRDISNESSSRDDLGSSNQESGISASSISQRGAGAKGRALERVGRITRSRTQIK